MATKHPHQCHPVSTQRRHHHRRRRHRHHDHHQGSGYERWVWLIHDPWWPSRAPSSSVARPVSIITYCSSPSQPKHTSPCAAYPVSRIVVVVVVVLPYLISYHDHQTNNHRTYTPPPLPSCQSAPPCTAGRRVDEAESGPSSKCPYPWALLLLLRRAQNASTTLAC